MPATAFGLRVIEEVTAINYGDKGYVGFPSTDGSIVYATPMNSADGSPDDISVGATPSGMYFTVKGY